MIDVPHLGLPLRQRSDGQLRVVEQGSSEEVWNCIEAIIRYRKGVRQDRPEFGISDPLFAVPVTNVERIANEVAEFEPRISLAAKLEIDRIDALIHNIKIEEAPDA